MRGIVSPKLEDFLAATNKAIADAKAQGIQYTPTQVRANLDKLAALMNVKPSIDFIEDRAFTMADGRSLQARVYSPNPTKPLPVVMHFHGGGHMCGSVALYDPVSRQLAHTAQCVVICVEYRLAPEHPYPAGIHDCQHALIHYQDVLSGIAHDGSIAIMGDSAGGAICTTLTMNRLKNPAIRIDKQILIYPSVDYTMSSASISSNGQGFLLEQARVRWYFQQYFRHALANEEEVKRASPLFGAFDADMPATLVFTAGCDPLRDEGIAYVNAMQDAGASVEHCHLDGMIHAYMLLQDLVSEECQTTYQRIDRFLNAEG
ncbi:alpha/beta hydrolase fold domain-containing protein [Shewanella waksmanii]|uniref:alpha/beta hydrolase fold domain-containing protein n=1 Tax=Shewanella waksmanii TaxID=213783 RepID=UPI00048EA573|nr:alpha/beta hydrolase [Shewanella waksmanii]